ncbi:MAG: hypothetical protein KC656_02300 [Myxococcales bacterium]|nr:hypothetical protein [Myxococcales bacterium]MCB9671208.1 hypothetical protein [Alphaproteobacteria bacterium]
MWFLLLACLTPDPPDPAPPGCAVCTPGTYCVATIPDVGEDPTVTTCLPVPDDCGDTLRCGDNTCRALAHAGCPFGTAASTCEARRITCIPE